MGDGHRVGDVEGVDEPAGGRRVGEHHRHREALLGGQREVVADAGDRGPASLGERRQVTATDQPASPRTGFPRRQPRSPDAAALGGIVVGLATSTQPSDILRRDAEQSAGVRDAEQVVDVARGEHVGRRRLFGGELEVAADLGVGHVGVAVNGDRAHRRPVVVVDLTAGGGDPRHDLGLGQPQQVGGVADRVQRRAERAEALRLSDSEVAALR
jgi:hypothetical protein